MFLHQWEADFAVWCSYKYLNSGPGGVGGLFVHWKHSGDPPVPQSSSVLLDPKYRRLAGWWGHDLLTRFQMGDGLFTPIPGAMGYRLSNTPVLLTESLRGSLEVFAEAGGMGPLRRKSVVLTTYLEMLLQHLNDPQLSLVTTSDYRRRGAQLSIVVGRGDLETDPKYLVKEIERKLERRGVIVDTRRGNALRVAPAPLYNSFVDVWLFVHLLKSVINQ
eukprot:TRINITY_DN844_c0_g1_i2.p1 TRINITY_DN844_c0_g1~~TRINITY_DN844_c0_g1_i2.p1  ORF type:complete len:218 (-),score=46.68 TRINITY_DN844_c0_g1_i2:23-676(-)